MPVKFTFTVLSGFILSGLIYGLNEMSAHHWLSAARPRTLPLALASVFCGVLLARLQAGGGWAVAVLSAATAVVLQVFSNLANDYGDACNGADSAGKQPPRMVGAGFIGKAAMKKALVLTALLACALGTALLACALPQIGAAGTGAWVVWLLLGALALVAAFTYTAGAKPYGYAGWGDLSVLLFFGWLGVLGSAYLQSGMFLGEWLLPATALGLWSSMVLNLNNMRDLESDKAAGKITVAVRLGPVRALYYHAVLSLAAAALWAVWLALHFNGAGYACLNMVLAGCSAVHLYRVSGVGEAAVFDRLLPRWSITVCGWVALLWLAARYGRLV